MRGMNQGHSVIVHSLLVRVDGLWNDLAYPSYGRDGLK